MSEPASRSGGASATDADDPAASSPTTAAEDSAHAAAGAAAEAVQSAGAAKGAAADAVQSAESAELAAADAADSAEAAQAVEAALEADELLLDEDAQRLHARVTASQPFGSPPRAGGRRSLLGSGFVVAVGVLLAVALAQAILVVASQLLLVVAAVIIATGLEPVVDWLVTRGLRRSFAVALIVVAGLGMLAAFLAAAIPPLQSEARQLIDDAPGYVQRLQDQHTAIGEINKSLHLDQRLRAAADAQLSANSVNGLLGIGRTVVSYTFQVLIVVVLTIYFLADFPGIKRAMYRLAPLPSRPRVGLLGDEILSRIGGYVLGNVLTSVIATIAQYAVLRTLGVPFSFVLAVFVGVFDLVPLIGSTIAGVVVTTVTLATVSTTAAVINVVFTLLYRIFEDYVLSPRILRRTVDVRPTVTIIAVLLGGALLGIEGALIAVPSAAAIQLFVTEVVYPHADNVEHPGSTGDSPRGSDP